MMTLLDAALQLADASAACSSPRRQRAGELSSGWPAAEAEVFLSNKLTDYSTPW